MKVKHSELVQFGRYVTSQSVKYLREKIFQVGVTQRGVMVAANQTLFIYLGEFVSNVGYFKGLPGCLERPALSSPLCFPFELSPS